ncbi:MAG: DUF3237 domain-containing protein [Burkholderiales bacterium]|nr:DUF3237 domain-containing protein [Burkholderiales bacterium]
MDYQPVAPRLALLYRAAITVEAPQLFGPTPQAGGERRIINITGGRFTGARLAGAVLPGGADWQVIRGDGVAQLEARFTMRTEDGALLYVRNFGYRHGPPEVIARLFGGEPVDPATYYFRMTPLIETGDARYAWLNALILVGSGMRTRTEVIYDVWAVE